VLQVYFYGAQYGTDTVFLCEFVLLFARRFFQATFKCKVKLQYPLHTVVMGGSDDAAATRARRATRPQTLSQGSTSRSC